MAKGTDPDGTQDPGPPPVHSDPLAGLVTGTGYQPEPLRVRVTEPPMPDIAAVREAMKSVLDADSELDLTLIPGVTQVRTADAPTGEIPVQAAAQDAPDTAPAPAPAAEETPVDQPSSTPPIGIPVQQAPVPAPRTAPPAAETPPSGSVPEPRGPQQNNLQVVRVGRLEKVRRLPSRLRRRRPQPAVRRKSSAGSLGIIVLLLLVIAVIVIVLIASFVDTITSIFG